MKGNTSFSSLSKEDGIHFIHEKQKKFFKLMYMAMSHFLQPENQAIQREEESGENLRSFNYAVFIVLSHLYTNILT